MIYALFIKVKENTNIKIGNFGKIKFIKGYYIYIGSAKKGLNARINRHYSKNKKIRWHIDYLLMNEEVILEKVFIKEELDECSIVKKIKGLPVRNFGSSGCNCLTHLFSINSIIQLKELGFKLFEKK